MVDIARGLSERGLGVDCVLVKAEGPYLDLVPEGVGVIDLRSHRTAAGLPGLLRYLWTHRPDVLLSTSNEAIAVALIAKTIFPKRLPVIARMSNHYSVQFRSGTWWSRRVSRLLGRLLTNADAIVAPSVAVAVDLRDSVPRICRLVTAIPNPVVWPEHAALACEPVAHPWFGESAPPVILSAGRLVPQKDHPTLLWAFAEIVRSRDARLVLIGEGPDRALLHGLSEKLNVSQWVDMPGFQANPFSYMKKSRVFVLPSRYEGLPNALIQAMACGTPVVATACPGGTGEILGDGRWGRLVPVGDWRGLARAVLDTMDDPVPSRCLIGRASCYSHTNAIDRYYSMIMGIFK